MAQYGDAWVPLQLALGLPLVPELLNELVCENAAVRPWLSCLLCHAEFSRCGHVGGQHCPSCKPS